MSELSPAYPPGDARNAIVEAGLTVFAADGFHGATMRRIALTAGVSQALLHHHFDGKDGLWRVVGERITADFLAYMTGAVDASLPARESIPAMLRGYMSYWQDHPAAFRFNLWRRLDGPASERAERSRNIAGPVTALFQDAQAADFVRRDMPPGLAAIIGGGIIQFWLHSQVEIRDALAATGDEGLTDEAFLEHVLALVRGVTGPAAG